MALAVALAGCAGAPPPVPEGYAGPTAVIADTTSGGGPGRGGKFFTLAEVDSGGKLWTSLDRSRAASFGQGIRLNVVGQQWVVKAGPARLKLEARVAYGAPIQELLAGGRMRSIKGTVDVVLKPDGRYVVTGFLDAYRTEIWLEDDFTHEIVGGKITAPADPADVAKSAASGKFTCCNLHYEDDTISDENFATLPTIPAGARIAILGYGRKTVDVLIEGRAMKLSVYVGDNLPDKTKRTSPQELARLLVVDEDPAVRLAAYPADVRAAIRAGKVMPGMTKAQVIMSLGYPWADKTPSLDAPAWSFHTSDDDEYTVVWDDGGRVRSIDGPAAVRAVVTP